MNNTLEIMELGMNCLLEHLGTTNTEIFISALIREKFDYTEWRKNFFGDASVHEINSAVVEYVKNYPFQPTRTILE